jgi:hypothetical protein
VFHDLHHAAVLQQQLPAIVTVLQFDQLQVTVLHSTELPDTEIPARVGAELYVIQVA